MKSLHERVRKTIQKTCRFFGTGSWREGGEGGQPAGRPSSLASETTGAGGESFEKETAEGGEGGTRRWEQP